MDAPVFLGSGGADIPDVAVTVVIRYSPKTKTFYAACEEHRGLLTAEHSLSAALASVVPALQDLLGAGPPHPNPNAFDGIEIS